MAAERIETARLVLRPLTVDDAEAAFVWCGDAEVNRFMPYSLYTRVEDVRAWLASVAEAKWEFGFVRRSDGLLIGSGGVSPDESSGAAWGLGYNLRRDCWGQGYATEAAQAMIGFAFRRFGVRDFVANHAKANPASGQVMRHCGMVLDHEGEYARFDGSEVFPADFYRLRLDRQGRARRWRFVPMDEAQCQSYLAWTYPPPYDFYNTPPDYWAECLQEYRDDAANWFAALDEAGRMDGMAEFSFRDGAMELGLGLRPESAGQGAGEQFVRSCLAFGRERYGKERPVFLRVAEFNRRAQKVYERVGFRPVAAEEAFSCGQPATFIRMELTQ